MSGDDGICCICKRWFADCLCADKSNRTCIGVILVANWPAASGITARVRESVVTSGSRFDSDGDL